MISKTRKMENTNEEHRRKPTLEKVYEPTLEEVYEKWQSQPATVELWGEMTEEIERAMEKERKNFGIPEEDEPPYEDESPCEEIITLTSDKSDKKDVIVIVISDDKDEDKKEKQERAREEYGITFEQYYNLI